MEKSIQAHSPTKKGKNRLHLIRSRQKYLSTIVSRKLLLLLCALLLVLGVGSLVGSERHTNAQATRSNCSWYHVVAGDTMGRISYYYRVNIWTVAHINKIRNVNLIYAGQNICIPHAMRRASSGLSPRGKVRWYAYDALEWSNRQQASMLIRQAAIRHGIPANLMLAIAWQESGWTHHVISRDGGIGIMQIMPYTAQSLNQQVHGSYDPYKLRDNIELGAIYLQSLTHGFHGHLTKIISAYNEGGWNVQHRGIFNWRYVRNVHALMYRY